MDIIILLVLILINGFFVMSEIALISARKTRIESLSNKGDLKAKTALKLIENPEEFLSTSQIGITLISILTGVYSGEKFSKQLSPYVQQINSIKPYAEEISTVLVVIAVTFLSIILGELIPKKMGLLRAEKIAVSVAGTINMISYLVHPFVWLLSRITNFIFRIFNIKKPSDHAVTEEEIKAMITEGSEQGSIEEDEKDIIERVFHLGDRSITSLMTHRTEIEWLDAKNTIAEIKTKMQEINFSTYPVCKGKIDEIIGIVHVKDMLMADDNSSIQELCKEALFVPENNTAYQLLEKLKSSQTHACFIINEYGTLEGMITLNDIVEAIVGDVSQPGETESEIVKREDGTFLIDGLIQFYDFLSYFERTDWMNEGEQDFDTLAGFALHRLEHIPASGEKFEWKDFKFEIIDMDGQRIDKLLVSISEELQNELKED
jgi:putative hemolysin